MFVADAHADTLYSLAVEGKSIEDCAVQASRMTGGYLQTFALFAGPDGPAGRPYEKGVAMLDALSALGVPVLTGALPDAPPADACGVVSIEGGEMLEGRLERLHEFHSRARLRMIALTWNHENEIGYPASGGTANPLKPFGHDLLREMDRLGILVDVSHLNEAGFFDAAARAKLPIIASHSNYRPLCDVPRNLTKDQVRTIIEKRGFIGINFYSRFLAKDRDAVLDDVLRHVDAICELGGEHALGLGSDFDGIESWPDGLGNPSEVENLLNLLLGHGYTHAQVENIAGLNLWRTLKSAEAVA